MVLLRNSEFQELLSSGGSNTNINESKIKTNAKPVIATIGGGNSQTGKLREQNLVEAKKDQDRH